VLAIVAYKQAITRAGIDRIRGTLSDSALETLLVRGLVAFDQHHLLVTPRAFLEFGCLRDLADLPPLHEPAANDQPDDGHVQRPQLALGRLG
jgi:segregation and condensation protein B